MQLRQTVFFVLYAAATAAVFVVVRSFVVRSRPHDGVLAAAGYSVHLHWQSKSFGAVTAVAVARIYQEGMLQGAG